MAKDSNIAMRFEATPYQDFCLNNDSFFVFFPKLQEVNNEILKVATLLMFAQIIDGFFTILGTSILGMESEGNFIIRQAMMVINPINSIILAKCLAILAILFLTFQSRKMRLILPVLIFSLGIYYICALLPWASIIGHQLAKLT